MITIGPFLKEAREGQGKSLYEVSRATKIKKNFLEALEAENWAALPEFTVIQGFVKNIAVFLKADEKKTLALLRRDYPPITPDKPKPDLSEEKPFWTPRKTFFLGVGLVLTALVFYLGLQYWRFRKPPTLILEVPTEDQIVYSPKLEVIGETEVDASLLINDQPVPVDSSGKFTTQIEVNENTQSVKVVATLRSGKKTTIERPIKVELGD